MDRALRFPFSLVVLLSLASPALAQRTTLAYITDADCDTEVCTSASAPGCREGNVLYFCDTAAALYRPAANIAGAAGSNAQVQFNSSGVFAGDPGMTFNAATDILSVEGLSSGLQGISSSAGGTFGGGITVTTGGLSLTQAGATVDGKNLDNAAMEDEANVFTMANLFSSGAFVAAAQKVALEGLSGDTHLIRTAATSSLDAYVDGAIGWSIIGGMLQAPPCPADLSQAPPGWCYDSSTGEHVIVGGWRAYP